MKTKSWATWEPEFTCQGGGRDDGTGRQGVSVAEQGRWCLMSRGTGVGVEAEQVVLPVSQCVLPSREGSFPQQGEPSLQFVSSLHGPLLKGQQGRES